MLVDLSEQELDMIIFSLNTVYVDSVNKLNGKGLGDLERKFIETTKVQTKDLIIKLGEDN